MRPEEILSLREKQERQLWAAVISTALDDAAGVVVADGSGNKKAIRKRARDWFYQGGRDFKEVCNLAGMDPDWIRARALEKIKACDGGVEYVPEPTKRTEPVRRRGRESKPIVIKPPRPPRPPKPSKRYEHDGKSLTLKEWSEATGIGEATLRLRLKQGWPIADVFTKALRIREIKERNRRFTFNGETHTLREWSAIIGVSAAALRQRVRNGLPIQEVLSPISGAALRISRQVNTKRYEHDGKSMTLRQWAEHLGMSVDTLYQRIHLRGWSVERTLSTPPLPQSERRTSGGTKKAA